MSGVRDRVNKAARTLDEAIRSGDQSLFLDYYKDEIEDIVDYLLGEDRQP
jgi:hypothetical protein